jgi:PAS domain S-box-containing protein
MTGARRSATAAEDCSAGTWDERARLAALDRYAILDTEREAAFDDIAALAADLFEAPIAVVNFVGEGRQWFKAEVGIGQRELPLDVSICRHAILQPGVLVVPDLALDPRFEANPLVTAEGGLRFYAGALLETPSGLPLGTVCVLDRKARPEGISEREQRLLKGLAAQVMAQLDLRLSEAQARRERERFAAAFNGAGVGMVLFDENLRIAQVNPRFRAIVGRGEAEIIGDTCLTFTHPDDRAENERVVAQVAGGLSEQGAFEKRYVRPDGSAIWVCVTITAMARDMEGRASSLLAVVEDATERVRAETEAAEQARLLEMIASGQPLDACLTAATAAVTHMEPRLRASVHLADAAGEAFEASYSAYVPSTFGSRMRGARIEEPASGTCGRAVLRHGPAACPDIATDEGWAKPWRDLCLSHGILACHSEPVIGTDGRCLASVMLAFDDVRPSSERERHLATFAARVAAIAIERDRSNEALRESEAHLATVFGQASAGLSEIGLDGRFLRVNDAMCDLLGRRREELLGFHVTDVTHPDDIAASARLIDEARGGGRPFTIEKRYLRPDGSVVWAASSVARIDEAGRPRCLLAVTVDISEQRAAQEAVRESEGRFRAAIDAVQGVLWTNTADGRMEGEQPGWAALTGQTREEYQGYGWASAVHPDDAQPTVEAWNAAVRERRTFVFEHRVRRHDGAWRIFSIRAIPVLDSQGEIREWVGVHADVTEQRAAQEALRESEARYREQLQAEVAERTLERDRIWQVSQDAFVVANTSGLYLNVSPGFERILGWTDADVVGKPFFDLVHPDDIAPTRAELGKLAEGVTTFYFENRFRHRDGEWRWLAWTAVPEGDLIYAVARDVTAEKATRAELEAAQAQVVEMQKLETIGQLTGGIAHDFNNLLTPIVGGLDMLRRRFGSDPRSARTIEGALQSAERARVLVNRLLAFARRQHLEARSVSLPDLVTGMGDLIDRSLGPQIEVRLSLPEDLPSVMVDPGQLELAVLNLAVNARDAMPAGGVLSIRAKPVTTDDLPRPLRPGNYVCLSVTDTGTGMDPNTLKRAIEPFYTTKGVGRGTGLGLSMVHGLAAQSGGALVLDSAPGAGTTAAIYLPVAARQAVAATAGGEVEEPVAIAPLTVLLVDDEELVRLGTADILDGLGHTVMQAASGTAALNLLRDGAEIDVMLTDYMMPGMTGVALAREARTLRPDLAVLLMTGYANLDPAVAGDLPRLGKPFRTSELTAKIREALSAGTAVELASRRFPRLVE